MPFKCKDCAQEFTVRWSLMNHRRDTHGKSKKKCIYKADNKCKYGANNGEECWYDHSDSDITQNTHDETTNTSCRTCGNTFTSKFQLLFHRKEKHPETVPE